MTSPPEERVPMKSGWWSEFIAGGEPVCRAHRNWVMMRAAPFSRKGVPGLHGVASPMCVLRIDYRTPRSLPARSGHDREDGGHCDCTAFIPKVLRSKRGKSELARFGL